MNRFFTNFLTKINYIAYMRKHVYVYMYVHVSI